MLRHTLVLLPLALLACSESRDDSTVTDASLTLDTPAAADVRPTPTDTPTDTPSADTARTPDAASPDVSAADASAGASAVVINEIRASGDDWVELFNPTTAAVDLSGFGLADTDPDGGAPRLSLAVRFSPGTTLAAGEYLLVLAGQNDAGVGVQTRCVDGGPSRCFHAGWSISASNGETVSLVNARSEVVARENYPANAAPSGSSWGRLPNGSGPFAVNQPTPGARNAAP